MAFSSGLRSSRSQPSARTGPSSCSGIDDHGPRSSVSHARRAPCREAAIGRRWETLCQGYAVATGTRFPCRSPRKGAQCEQRLGDRLATQPGHAADRGWNTTTPHREVLVEYLAEPIDYLPAEPRAPPRLLRPPCAGLPRPMPESLVVAERHPIHRASVCLLVSGDHPATPKTRRRPSLPRRPLLFEL